MIKKDLLFSVFADIMKHRDVAARVRFIYQGGVSTNGIRNQ